MRYVGFSNYVSMLNNDVLWRAFTNNLVYLGVCLVIMMPGGFLLALFLNRDFVGNGLLRTLLYIPVILSGVASGLVWAFMLNPGYGLINSFLRWAGLDGLALQWIGGTTRLSMISIGVVDSWKQIGYYTVFLLAGLKLIPEEYKEAAVIDGAGWFARLRLITMPLLRDYFAVCILLIIVRALNAYESVFMLTNGQPNNTSHVLGTYIYFVQFGEMRPGPGAAASILMFVLIMAFSVINYVATSKNIDE